MKYHRLTKKRGLLAESHRYVTYVSLHRTHDSFSSLTEQNYR